MTAISCSVFPLRFTDRPEPLIDFLALLGMAPVVTTPGGGFADLVAGGGGHVMVHAAATASSEAAAGDTRLCFSVPAVDPAAAALRAQGCEVRVWDEAYGRQAAVADPRGGEVSLNEEQVDLYGYVGHDGAAADARLSVTAVRDAAAGDDRDRDVAFFERLGFVPTGDGDERYRELRASGGGAIGLHAPEPPGAPAPGDRVRLGFTTTEGLDALAARLAEAGHPARAVDRRAVHVTDPDGQRIEIHPRDPGPRDQPGGAIR